MDIESSVSPYRYATHHHHYTKTIIRHTCKTQTEIGSDSRSERLSGDLNRGVGDIIIRTTGDAV